MAGKNTKEPNWTEPDVISKGELAMPIIAVACSHDSIQGETSIREYNACWAALLEAAARELRNETRQVLARIELRSQDDWRELVLQMSSAQLVDEEPDDCAA